MKVKQYIFMSLTALALSACGGDDESDAPQPSVSSAVEVKYQATLSDDLLKVADVTAYYVSADGTVKNEPVQATPWAKDVSIPADKLFGFALRYAAKSSTSIDAATEYALKSLISVSYNVNDQNGSSMALGKKEQTGINKTLIGSGVKQFLSGASSSVAYMWNGTTVTTATIDWGFNAESGNSTDTPVSGDPASDGAE